MTWLDTWMMIAVLIPIATGYFYLSAWLYLRTYYALMENPFRDREDEEEAALALRRMFRQLDFFYHSITFAVVWLMVGGVSLAIMYT